MSLHITHFAVLPGPAPESGPRPFRVEATVVDERTGRVLLDRRGEDAMRWPDCVELLPHAARAEFVGSVAAHLVRALAADARAGHYQLLGSAPGVAAAAGQPDTAPFAAAHDAAGRHRLLQLLVRADGALRDLGATFFLGGGGLLGLVRCGDLLPWDGDLDLELVGTPPGGSWDALAALLALPLGGLDVGTVAPAPGCRTRLRVAWPGGAQRLDVRAAGEVDGRQLRTLGPTDQPDEFTDLDLCLPAGRGRLGPVEVAVPADPAGWLKRWFGPHCLDSALPPEDRAAGDAAPARVRVPLGALLTPPVPPPTYGWISQARLAADAIVLAGRLPPDVAGVVALPRSGVLPAALIATQLHLPLWELTRDGRLHRLGGGHRAAAFDRDADGVGLPGSPGRLAVVDDIVFDGNALTQARGHLRRLGRRAVFTAVYARERSAHAADLFVRHVEEPQLLEWNLLNNGCVAGRGGWTAVGGGVGLDFDGVVCHDDLSGGDPGTPYLLPRLHEVPVIATGRPESMRAQTEGWLRQWGVRCGSLRMLADGVPLRTDTAARHKADHYGGSDLGLFVESCPKQAALIHRWTGKPVLCPRADFVFSRTQPGPGRLAHLKWLPRCDHDTQDHPLEKDINATDGLLRLLEYVGPVGRVAEVGCYRGVSTEVWAVHAAEVVCVDVWHGSFWARGNEDFEAMAAGYPGVRVIRRPSVEAAALVPDGCLDMAYIDADHAYDSARADIAAWLPKVRPGGFMAGHDYTPHVQGGGVIRAVDELFGKPDRVFGDTSWVVRKPR